MKHSRRGEIRQKYWWFYIINVLEHFCYPDYRSKDSRPYNQNYRRKG